MIRDKRLDNSVLMGQSKWHALRKQNQNEYFTLTSKLSFRTPCLPGQIHYVPVWASSGYSSVDKWPYNSPFSDHREILCNTAKLLFFITQIRGHAHRISYEPSQNMSRKQHNNVGVIFTMVIVTTVIVSLNKALNLWSLQRDCPYNKYTLDKSI